MKQQWTTFWRAWRLASRGAGMWAPSVPDAFEGLVPYEFVRCANANDDMMASHMPVCLRQAMLRVARRKRNTVNCTK